MFKPYLRSIVRNGGKGRMGFGIELFRLDDVDIDENELTAEEKEAVEESDEPKASTAVMRIYESIGEDFWTGGGVTAKKFSDELEAFGDIKRLNIHINCLGGDVFTAQAIHSIVADHESKKTAYIDGVAASAATIIACAADEVIARHNTNYMIHHPWCMAIGNADTMKKAADDLEAITIPIVNVYKEQVKGKVDDEKIRSLMDDETWMTAEQALEYGFVDRVRGKIKAIAKVNKSQIFCSGRLMDVAKYHYHNVPKYPEQPKAKAKFAPPPDFSMESLERDFQKPEQERKETIMTREEIDPKLLGEIQDEARTAERVRLGALDAMNGPGLDEIISKAKAEGKKPEDVAMECFEVTKKQLLSAKSTNALMSDAKVLNGIAAGDAPLVKAKSPKDESKRIILNAFRGKRHSTTSVN